MERGLIMVEFGNRLKHLRKQHNLTQKQLASLIGVKNSIISFYELGDRIPSPQIVVSLASVFHVSTDYLLGVQKEESINISGLDEDDKKLVGLLIDTLRKKNQK